MRLPGLALELDIVSRIFPDLHQMMLAISRPAEVEKFPKWLEIGCEDRIEKDKL